MASVSSNESYWESLLGPSYKITELEKQVYLERQEDATCNEMFAKFICDEMQKRNLSNNLAKLYEEAVYGKDAAVRKRMITRIYTVRQKVL